MQREHGMDLRVVAAFAIVYVVWGSTYLAIRVVLQSVPPALSAAVRFLCAGLVMLGAARVTGRTLHAPRREMRSLALIGLFLLVGGNGVVVWAQQYVPSGLAALTVATLPLWMAVMETIVPGGDRVPPLGWLGVLLGFGGLAILLSPKLTAGTAPTELRAELILLAAPISWGIGSLYSKRVHLTVSPMVATGWEMLCAGAVFTVIALVAGEFPRFAPTPAAWAGLAYLVLFGSCLAFTAYIWLLHHVAAAKVVTYAYVNPVIAVFLGWLVMDEPFTSAMALGTPIILLAVALVTGAKARAAVVAPEPVPARLSA